MNCLLIGYMHGRGGIQSHTHFLATGLTERGHSVLVLTPKPFEGHHPAAPTDRNYDLVTYDGIRDIAKVSMDGGQIDVAIVCGVGWAAMLGVRLNRRVQKRVFFEVMSGDRIGKMDPRSIIHTGFDALVGQAPTVEQKFCDVFNWNGIRTAIPALPEPLEHTCDVQLAAKAYKGSSGPLKLCYFGRLAAHKRVDFLIENWNHFSATAESLDVWGGGSEKDRLQAMIDAQGLTDQIRLKGRYPDGQAYVDLLKGYDLKLLPTDGAEGAPLVLLEAMALGVPFVANGVGGIPNYTNEDCEVTSGDLSEFLGHYDRFIAKARSGSISPQRLQNFYTEKFSYKALLDQWENFLVNLDSGQLKPN